MAIGSLISKGASKFVKKSVGKLAGGKLGGFFGKDEKAKPAVKSADLINGLRGELGAYGGGTDESPWQDHSDILQVRLSSSLLSSSSLTSLQRTNGLIFPYTPTIIYSYSSDWNSYDLTHTNYQPKTFTKSEVSEITISGQFTAQTQKEAMYCLEMLQFLRAMSKMRYGVNDELAGAPPPVMKLNAYGTVFDNIPVVLTSFNHELNNDADYIMVNYTDNGKYLQAAIPTSFLVTVVLTHQPNLATVTNSFVWNEFLSNGQKGFL